MADRRQEHRLGLTGLLCRRRHLLQRLLHLHPGTDVDHGADGHLLVAVTRAHEADLQVLILRGDHIQHADLLFIEQAYDALTIFRCKLARIVMGQLVTEDVAAVTHPEDRDPHRRRRHNLTVKLLVLLEAQRVVLRREEHLAFK